MKKNEKLEGPLGSKNCSIVNIQSGWERKRWWSENGIIEIEI